MKKDYDKKNLVIVDEDAAQGFTRWLPTIIVFCVVGGFFTLSWYAYHAGVESVRDEDLLVVEADKTPMKEKPADPGGMQFPNQDKTIFDTFSGNKPTPQNVERILPSPEEPMSKDADTSETSTWINNKLTAGKPAAEQVIGKKKDTKAEKTSEKSTAPAERQVIPVSAPDEDDSETFVASRTANKAGQVLDNAVKETDKAAIKAAKEADEKVSAARLKAEKDKAEKEKADKEKADKEQAAKEQAAKEEAAARELKEAKEEAARNEAAKQQLEKTKAAEAKAAAAKATEEKKAEDKAAAARAAEEKAQADKEAKEKAAKEKAEAKTESKPAASGNAAVQLGAYRSEDEASEAWEKMHIKFKELSDKQPTIVRADLGEKGIYYRLRITGLDAAGANAMCRALTAKGQPCILPVGK